MFFAHLSVEMSGKRNAIIPPAAKIAIALESVDTSNGPSIKVVDETSKEEERSQKVFLLNLGKF
jgi:hypothetical protein